MIMSVQFGIGYFGAGARTANWSPDMSGNPEECRQHALECMRLAQASITPQRREFFAKLARTWIGLAEELERSRHLVDDSIDEPKKRTG